MKLSQMTVGQRIAMVIRDFEQRRLGKGREWVAVFMNEETVVIALHRALSLEENTLAGNPAGCALVSKSQRRLYADAALLQKVQSITGMEVLDTTVELEPRSGGLALLFTTNAVGRISSDPQANRAGASCLWVGPACATRRRNTSRNQITRVCYPNLTARVLTKGVYDEDRHVVAEGCQG